jgi:hypothetical protein
LVYCRSDLSNYLVRARNIMNHGLVLLSGIGFIVFSGFIFLMLSIVENYPLKSRTKRIIHFCAFTLLSVLCIYIFDWYSSDYIRTMLAKWKADWMPHNKNTDYNGWREPKIAMSFHRNRLKYYGIVWLLLIIFIIARNSW